jgi:hypothetical protein
MTIDRRKNPFLDKTKTTTKTTAHTTSTAPFMALALAVVGIIMMTNLVFPGGGSLSAYAAASTETQSFRIPVDITHTAAESGCSEDIHLTGQLHIVTHTTVNDKGVVIVKTHFNPQGITGEGIDPVTQEPTGTTYQGTGVTSSSFTFKPGAAQTQTEIINFNLIGHGSTPDTDSIHHLNAHLTVNADGTATAEVFNEINDCR